MTEEQVFLAALELTDPADRTAYLDKACGRDAEFRRQVEGLLAAHFQSGEFLDEPIGKQMAAGPATPTNENTVSLHTKLGGEAVADEKKTDEETDDLHFLQPSTRPDSLGRIGHYEVLEILGRGGFGIVFRAFDEVLQRVVALKVLAPAIAATSPARKRFLREARSSAQVRHENVVQVHAVEEQPLPYLVMEFIPGETLQQRLDRTGPLESLEIVRIGRQIAEGLAAAHAMDLIHRDIKPGNILLEGGQQRVKITDFGLARAADDASLTQSGVLAGTPMYMAPEQAQGVKIDHRADLFSLGSVLYVMATGRPPFRASTTFAVLKRVVDDDPRPIQELIPETPQWLCDIIAKLHAKKPEERYQSAREVADVLADCETRGEGRAARGGRRPVFSRPSPLTPRTTTAGRWKWVAAAMVVLAGLGLWFGPAVMLYFSDRGELEILPGQGLVDVIVLHNDEGVIDPNKLHASVTDWLSMKEQHTLTLPAGRYQLNVGTYPAGTVVGQWEVTTSGLFGADRMAVPATGGSAIVTVERGRRVTLRPIMRPAPPTDLPKNDAAPLAVVTLKYGDPEYTNTLGMKFKLIPAGKFTMGSSQEEIDRCLKLFGNFPWVKDNVPTEGPEHPVEITQPFYMGATDVTVGQFRQFVDDAGYQVGDGRWRNPGFDQTDQHPVVFVSWNNAVDFCKWLSKKEGKEYRLPTEAEWEYSCRAGKAGSRYCFGDDEAELENYAWYNKNSGGGTHPVGKKKPNAWGLYDMHGNVWPWCQDNYDPDYYKTSPVKDPPGPGAGGERVARGGAWDSPDVCCRSAFRQHGDPGRRGPQGGFRVLLVSPPGGVRTESGAKDKAVGAPAVDPDRRAAEYVLSIGGGVKINDQEQNVKAIADLPREPFRLTYVDIRRPELTDNGLASFKGCKNLVHLALDVTNIDGPEGEVTDVGLAYFKDCKNLTSLSLVSGGVTDAGLLYFNERKNLTNLSLNCPRVMGAGLGCFKGCKNLTDLNLNGTPVSEAGSAAFADCKNLKNLDLGNTGVTDAGAAHFKDCKNLIDLSLHRSPVSEAGIAAFRDCKNLKSLNLNETQVGGVGLAQLKDCKALRALQMWGAKMTDAGLAGLQNFKCLTNLTLWGAPVSDAGLAHFAGLDDLTDLDLRSTKVTGRGLKGLAKVLPKCTITWDGGVIEPNDGSDRRAAEYVLSVGGVVEINRDSEITAAAKLPVAGFGFRLTRAGLGSNPDVTDAGLAAFKNCQNLNVLDLTGTPVTDAGLSHLAGLSGLTNLLLVKTKATAKGVEDLAKALPKCKITWDGGVFEPK